MHEGAEPSHTQLGKPSPNCRPSASRGTTGPGSTVGGPGWPSKGGAPPAPYPTESRCKAEYRADGGTPDGGVGAV